MNIRAARFMTQALAGLCAALLLLVLVQYVGFGRGYAWSPPADSEGAQVALANIDQQPVKLPPASAFGDIAAHPLFNEDRQPTPLDSAEAAGAASPPSPLSIALTGVILDEANHVRIAMLQDKASNQPIALKVGMPLEGDQASWTLVEVKPRAAVFRSAANETTEVELETSLVQPPAAPRNPRRPAAPAAGQAATAQQPGAKGTNASADLATRIEERRRQMREDAERLRNGASPRPAPNKK